MFRASRSQRRRHLGRRPRGRSNSWGGRPRRFETGLRNFSDFWMKVHAQLYAAT